MFNPQLQPFRETAPIPVILEFSVVRLPNSRHSAGQVGKNWARRKDGTMEKLKGCDETVIDVGEVIIIQTPTAGGFGKA